MNAPASLFAFADDTDALSRTPVALFPVEPPDGRRDWTEAARQTVFFSRLRMAAPSLKAWHTPNEGRRNPMKALASGIVGGVFDVSVASGPNMPRQRAEIELKGYDARGRAGSLSPAQIDWGNVMHAAGHPVACFFDPDAAIAWLRLKFPAAFS